MADTRLEDLQGNLREAVEMARASTPEPGTAHIWFLLGAMSAALDGLFTELIKERNA